MGAGAQVVEISALPDPCPLPGTAKKRSLNERERLLYAPMADVGGLLYDKDAVYINVPDWKARPGSTLRSLSCVHLCSARVAARSLPCACPGPGVMRQGSMQPGALDCSATKPGARAAHAASWTICALGCACSRAARAGC